MSYFEHRKGGNCPKSKGENWGTRRSFKFGASKLRRGHDKEEIKKQVLEGLNSMYDVTIKLKLDKSNYNKFEDILDEIWTYIDSEALVTETVIKDE